MALPADTASGLQHGKTNGVLTARTLFEEYENFIRKIIARTYPMEAEDLFQDFFIAMVAKPLPEYVKNIKAYLARSIVHDITDWLRQNARYRANLQKYSSFTNTCRERKHFFETIAARNEAQYILDLAREHLPTCLFQVLRLRFEESLDIPKIADRIGTTPRSASVYLSNALRITRELVHEYAVRREDQPDECVSTISD